LKTKEESPFDQSVSYSTESNVSIHFTDHDVMKHFGKAAALLRPLAYKNSILVPVLSRDLSENYLDHYDYTGLFIKRLRIPPFRSDLYISSAAINPRGFIFFSVSDHKGISWIEAFSIMLE
jgi:hypothetical protein